MTDFSDDLKNRNKPVVGGGNPYKYPSADENKEIDSFSIDAILKEKIKRDVYWNRHQSKSELVNTILADYYRDKDFEPIPKGKK